MKNVQLAHPQPQQAHTGQSDRYQEKSYFVLMVQQYKGHNWYLKDGHQIFSLSPRDRWKIHVKHGSYFI